MIKWHRNNKLQIKWYSVNICDLLIIINPLNKVCEYVTPQKLYIEICELIFQTVLVAVVVY